MGKKITSKEPSLNEVLRNPAKYPEYKKEIKKFTNWSKDFWNKWELYAGESGFTSIYEAAQGSKKHIDELRKKWGAKINVNILIAKKEKMSIDEERELIRELCWEEFSKRSNRLLADMPKLVKWTYYKVSDAIGVEEAGQNEKIGPIKLQPYLYSDGKQYLFVNDVARFLKIHPSTVKKWIKMGKISGDKKPYYSRKRQAEIQIFLIPYDENIESNLEQLLKINREKLQHHIDNLYTISQITKTFKISRSTLKRLDKSGKVKPKRINSIRYYTMDDIKTLMMTSKSKKMKEAIQSYSKRLPI